MIPDAVNYFYETSQQITTSNLDVIKNGPMGKDEYLQQYIKAWDSVNLLPIQQPARRRDSRQCRAVVAEGHPRMPIRRPR